MTAQAAINDQRSEPVRDFGPLRILIVDDASHIRTYVRRILEKSGFNQIAEASDGIDALEQVISFKANLVFLDIKMEPMNGLQFLKMVRSGETPIPRDLPVIVLTGAEDDAILGSALALDCDALLSKPTSYFEIGERIWRITSTKPSVRPSIAYKVITIPEMDECISTTTAPSDTQGHLTSRDKILAMDVGTVLNSYVRTVSGNILLASGTVLTKQYQDRLADIAKFTDIVFSKGEDD